MTNLRNSVFEICKKFKSSTEFDNLRNTMASLFITREDEIRSPEIDAKHDIAHNGMRLNCEFNGILLAFERGLSVFELKGPVGLSEDEYYQLSMGNYIITNFIKRCLDEIGSINPTIGKVLNPYAFFVPIKENTFDFNYDLAVLDSVVAAFKESKIYREIMKSKVLQMFASAPEQSIFTLMGTMDRDIIKIPMENVPNEIFALKMRELESRHTHKIEKMDAISILSFKLLALREMLKNACRLLYSAILGLDLLVFDENCLIDIEKDASNTIYQHKTILIQGIPTSPYKEVVGDIILFTLNTDRLKIHEFGFVRSITINFGMEDEGQTSKVSFCVVDDDLNPIFSLTR